MKKHATTIEAEVEITPTELAALFWSCDQIEQVRFFNALAEYAPRPDFEIQMLAVVEGLDSAVKLTPDAVNLLKTISDVLP